MKIPALKLNDRIEVWWRDIVANAKWLSDKEASCEQPSVCQTMGYFLNVADGCLRVSGSRTSEQERDVVVIPLGNIYKVLRLK